MFVPSLNIVKVDFPGLCRASFTLSPVPAMSEGMSLSSRALKSATSRLSSLKGYIGQPRAIPSVTSTQAPEEDGRATWIARAGQKIRLRRGNSDGASIGTETLSLFPGWAVRRYKPGHPDGEGEFVDDSVIWTGTEPMNSIRSRSVRVWICHYSTPARIPYPVPTRVHTPCQR